MADLIHLPEPVSHRLHERIERERPSRNGSFPSNEQAALDTAYQKLAELEYAIVTHLLDDAQPPAPHILESWRAQLREVEKRVDQVRREIPKTFKLAQLADAVALAMVTHPDWGRPDRKGLIVDGFEMLVDMAIHKQEQL